MDIKAESQGDRFEPIPRILHQTWKTNIIPEHWQGFRQSWLDNHPDWKHRLWTDADIEKLVVEKEPEFVAVFRGFRRDIQRVDAAKLLILKHYGGVYADLDTQCLRAVDPLLEAGGMLLSRTSDGAIEGAFMAAPSQHPFFGQALERMRAPTLISRFFLALPGLQATGVLLSTGPFMLYLESNRYMKSVRHLPAAMGIRILKPEYCSSKSWWNRHKPFTPKPETFVLHLHADSWLSPLERAIVRCATPAGLFSAMLLIGLLLTLLLVGGEA